MNCSTHKFKGCIVVPAHETMPTPYIACNSDGKEKDLFLWWNWPIDVLQ